MIRCIAFDWFVIVTLSVCLIGCATVEKPKPSAIWVMCDECYGDGRVIYGPDHPAVKQGFPQGVFECPMCGGTGRLYEDQENYPARIPKHDH